MSQLRLNPLNGRWVTIVADRGERPTDFAPRLRQVEADPSRPCPFCPGNEELTPPALETSGDDGTWQVRVVPNKFPAFSGSEPMVVTHLGPVFIQAPAGGTHEVIVISPRHDASFADLTDRQMTMVVGAIRDRMVAHSTVPGLRYSQAIVNHGREAGASLAHPHGQLLGIPFVPRGLADELAGFARFRGSCLLCTTLEAEAAAGHRVILENDKVLVVCPFWSGTPFELLVIPKLHDPHLYTTAAAHLDAVAVAVRDALAMLRGTVGDVAYNVVFHSAPFRVNDDYHWHVHLLPKLATRAGFELGTGVLLNVMPPEMAAQALRGEAGSS
jgi:UDPglucose--hexose-1-phosphate uridylyltransferase